MENEFSLCKSSQVRRESFGIVDPSTYLVEVQCEKHTSAENHFSDQAHTMQEPGRSLPVFIAPGQSASRGMLPCYTQNPLLNSAVTGSQVHQTGDANNTRDSLHKSVTNAIDDFPNESDESRAPILYADPSLSPTFREGVLEGRASTSNVPYRSLIKRAFDCSIDETFQTPVTVNADIQVKDASERNPGISLTSPMDRNQKLAIVAMGCQLAHGCDDVQKLWQFLNTQGDSQVNSCSTCLTDVRSGHKLDSFGSLTPDHSSYLEIATLVASQTISQIQDQTVCGIVMASPYSTQEAPNELAKQISNKLDLFAKVCIDIDEDCVSGFVGLKTAEDLICSEQCATVLVGGIYLMTDSARHTKLLAAGMLSTTQVTRAFDLNGSGFLLGKMH